MKKKQILLKIMFLLGCSQEVLSSDGRWGAWILDNAIPMWIIKLMPQESYDCLYDMKNQTISKKIAIGAGGCLVFKLSYDFSKYFYECQKRCEAERKIEHDRNQQEIEEAWEYYKKGDYKNISNSEEAFGALVKSVSAATNKIRDLGDNLGDSFERNYLPEERFAAYALNQLRRFGYKSNEESSSELHKTTSHKFRFYSSNEICAINENMFIKPELKQKFYNLPSS